MDLGQQTIHWLLDTVWHAEVLIPVLGGVLYVILYQLASYTWSVSGNSKKYSKVWVNICCFLCAIFLLSWIPLVFLLMEFVSTFTNPLSPFIAIHMIVLLGIAMSCNWIIHGKREHKKFAKICFIIGVCIYAVLIYLLVCK